MRQFLSLCTLFLLTLTAAIAQSADKMYMLTCFRGSLGATATHLTSTFNTSYSAGNFAFVTYEGDTYLYAVDVKRFITKTGEASTQPDGTVNYPGSAGCMTIGGNGVNVNGVGEFGIFVGGWTTPDNGNQFTLTETGDFDPSEAKAMLESYFKSMATATVTYVIKDESGNTVYSSESMEATVGQQITTLPESLQRSYCSYSVTPTTVEQGDNVVEVTVSYALPFSVSESYEKAIWYFVKVRTSWISMDSTEPYYFQASQNKNESGMWAFAGNPYDGFYILNKAAGADMRLTKDGNNAVMRSGSDERWEISASGTGFSLLRVGSAMDYINQIGGISGYLGIWSSDFGRTDAGGKWELEEVSTEMVSVTYNLFIDGTLISRANVKQQAYSETAIPQELISDYSSLAYDFTTEGTIGDRNCFITVTATLKDGVVTEISQLSNAKSYMLKTSYGTRLGIDGKNGYSASPFSLLSYGGAYYLYSIRDGKFISAVRRGMITDDLEQVTPLTFEAQAIHPLYFLHFGDKTLNISFNYVIINGENISNEGNQFLIVEAGDFDASAALEVLKAYNESDQYATVVYELYEDGVLVASQTDAKVAFGEEITDIPAAMKTGGPYIFDVTPLTVSESTNTVHAERQKLDNLSAYTLTTRNGGLTTWERSLASTSRSDLSNFAIVNVGNAYYLYSLKDNAFIGEHGNETYLCYTPVVFDTGSYPYRLTLGGQSLSLISDYNVDARCILLSDQRSEASGEDEFIITRVGDVTAEKSAEILAMLEDGEKLASLKAYFAQPSVSVASIEAGKVYTVTSRRGNWLADESGLATCTSPKVVSPDPSDVRQHFAPIPYDGKFYLYSPERKAFLATDGTWATSNSPGFNFLDTENAAYPYFIMADEDHYVNITGRRLIVIDSWSTLDDGNRFKFLEVEGVTLSEEELKEALAMIRPQAPAADLNGDGAVNVGDVTTLVNMILGKAAKTSVADLNGDGDINVGDVTALVNMILGK